MKVIVTGMRGTVAPALARRLGERGHEVVAWDRGRVPAGDPAACRAFVADAGADWLFHVATGPPEWAETIARACADHGVGLLFTSSVSVFSDRRQGPYGVDLEPDATDDYGAYKIECERRVRGAHPGAIVARLGWQIGDAPGSNTMVDHLSRAMERDGRIEASARWLPSCSFLADTADALCDLAERHAAGTYHLEGNPGLSFLEVALALDRVGRRGWRVVAAEAPVLDNRMQDPRVRVVPITGRFTTESTEDTGR